MAKCVVLGANGFIGSHLIDSLVDAGHDVRCFGRFGHGAQPQFAVTPQVEIMRGDFLNTDDMERAVDGMDYVFHFISTTTPATAENDPVIDIETNVKASVRLFQICVAKGVKRVLFASTGGAIYGSNSGAEPVSEAVTPQPISPYAIGKLSIEHYLHYFRTKHNLDSLVYRISNPYGERQPLHSKQGVIPIFLQRIANDEPLIVLGDGSMVRDYLYVKDVARMIAGSFETAKHNVYNIGSGHGVAVNELVTTMSTIVGREISVEHQPAPPTFVDKVVLDATRFIEEFPDLKPTTSLEEGIRKTWDYVQVQKGLTS